MPAQSTNPESTLHTVDGVHVYARRDDQGKPTKLDAIHEDEARIRDIADRLQKQGFGVVRRRDPRAGKIYFTLKATWVGDGPPPEDPFGANSRR